MVSVSTGDLTHYLPFTGRFGFCRAVILAGRDVGRSAGGQMDNRQVVESVALGLCPRRSLNFKTTVAHKGRRYQKFSAISNCRRLQEKFRLTRGLPSREEIFRLTVGLCFCATENFSAHLEVRPPEKKFFRGHLLLTNSTKGSAYSAREKGGMRKTPGQYCKVTSMSS